MIILKIKDLEKKLNKLIKRNTKCLGVDTASRTGWALITTNSNEVIIDYGILNIKTTNNYYKYNYLIGFFDKLIYNNLNKNSVIVIEDTFYHFNPKMYAFISRVGMIVYTIAEICSVKNKYFITAAKARKNLGFKGTAKKEEIHRQFRDSFYINIKDKDVVDAIILALNGIIKEVKL